MSLYFIRKMRLSSFRRALGDLMMTMFNAFHLLPVGSGSGRYSIKPPPFYPGYSSIRKGAACGAIFDF